MEQDRLSLAARPVKLISAQCPIRKPIAVVTDVPDVRWSDVKIVIITVGSADNYFERASAFLHSAAVFTSIATLKLAAYNAGNLRYRIGSALDAIGKRSRGRSAIRVVGGYGPRLCDKVIKAEPGGILGFRVPAMTQGADALCGPTVLPAIGPVKVSSGVCSAGRSRPRKCCR